MVCFKLNNFSKGVIFTIIYFNLEANENLFVSCCSIQFGRTP